MAQQVTIPDDLYQRLQRRAEARQRTVEAELAKTLATGLLIEEDQIPPDFAAIFTDFEATDDDALLQAAASPNSAQMEAALHEMRARQERADLSPAEKRALDNLLYQYNLASLMRFKAAALLRQRRRRSLSN
jgi:plasmid stability protein